MTLKDISRTLDELITWNNDIPNFEAYHTSQTGMQLLAANCTLITAIGEGINRCNRNLPGFLEEYFPDIPWSAIIGMRNHIAHGYFELDSEIVFEAVKSDIPPLREVIRQAISYLENNQTANP